MLIGEIGGDDEETAAAYIKAHFKKPIFGFISGRSAPPGKRMGHAGAIISGGKGTPEAKVAAFEEAVSELATVSDTLGDRDGGSGQSPRLEWGRRPFERVRARLQS